MDRYPNRNFGGCYFHLRIQTLHEVPKGIYTENGSSCPSPFGKKAKKNLKVHILPDALIFLELHKEKRMIVNPKLAHDYK